jgi:hypothetical protein
VLDEEMVGFLQGGCALIVCTIDVDGEPSASRGWGLTVLSADAPVRVRLLVTPDVIPQGRIAITGTDVPTLRSTQLKGHIVSVEPADSVDAEKTAAYLDHFYGDVVRTDNIPRDLVERLTPSELVALTVEVDELYNQTPGPRAGASLS